ncbi:MAG: UBP-type zinc finger domain-containing protein [Acidimicrobiia bacterium]|nr:UBP-type zinc finger domain-containing protein [Acidimicrobiia bacterium]
MSNDCSHLPPDLTPPPLTASGCEACLAAGKRDWVHLRFCQTCGRIGCCDNSPGKHATAHYQQTGHALIRSFEPGEEWFWCYADEIAFEIAGAPQAPSY